MGHGAVAAFCYAERSSDTLATADHQTIDRQFRTRGVVALADGARHPAAELGTIGAKGAEQLALSPRRVRRSLGTQMDAAGHRTAKTQGRKLVSIATQSASDVVTGDKRELPAGPR